MKYDMNFTVTDNRTISPGFVVLKLQRTDGAQLPDIRPGQFVEVAIPDSKTTFLRRPISVNFISDSATTLHLLVRIAGEGTAALAALSKGRQLQIMLPLGNGFTVDSNKRMLLVGGGVGVAPLLYHAACLSALGNKPDVLLGARSASMLLQADEFARYANVLVATDDGTLGHHGLVTTHPALCNGQYDLICCCGPLPMMKAVAAVARQRNIECEVSLENMMACGLGACLCCVEKTIAGNVCVCTEGPVFNTRKLCWI